MKKQQLSYFLSLFFCSMALQSYAQTEHQWLLEANRSYDKKKLDEAAASYEKVIQQNKNSVKGQYNLGNTRYKQKEYDQAIKHFQGAVQQADDEEVKARAYHNLGNAHYRKEEFKEAVDAYKNALRINPRDVETKHNMAQALRIIRQNQPPPPQNDQQDKKEQQENKPPPPDEMSQDEVDRMLENIDQEDKKTQENKKRQPSQRRPPEKDW